MKMSLIMCKIIPCVENRNYYHVQSIHVVIKGQIPYFHFMCLPLPVHNHWHGRYSWLRRWKKPELHEEGSYDVWSSHSFPFSD